MKAVDRMLVSLRSGDRLQVHLEGRLGLRITLLSQKDSLLKSMTVDMSIHYCKFREPLPIVDSIWNTLIKMTAWPRPHLRKFKGTWGCTNLYESFDDDEIREAWMHVCSLRDELIDFLGSQIEGVYAADGTLFLHGDDWEDDWDNHESGIKDSESAGDVRYDLDLVATKERLGAIERMSGKKIDFDLKSRREDYERLASSGSIELKGDLTSFGEFYTSAFPDADSLARAHVDEQLKREMDRARKVMRSDIISKPSK